MEAQKQESKGKNEHLRKHPFLENENGIVSIYDTHLEAEAAVKQMQHSGFDMKRLSIVGRDFHTEESVIGYYNLGDRTKFWGKVGAFWGGMWGLLFGSAFFVVPGIGPVVVAGSFVAAIIGALEGAVLLGGFTALGAALFSIGIPKNSVLKFETAIKGGRYLLMAHGTSEELKKARDIIRNSGAKDITDFESKKKSDEPAGKRH